MLTNIRSLTINHSELAQISKKCTPVIIVLKEIWNPHIGAVSLTGFHQLVAKTRSSSRGGGVGIYISKQHRFEILEKVNNLSMKYLESE